MRQYLSSLLKILVAAALFYFLFSRIEDPNQLWLQLRNANKSLLLAALVCYAGAVATGAVKWGILLQAAGIEVARPQLLRYQWMAEFFNNFLPGQVGGDVVRGMALGADTQRRSDVAATVLLDRILGLLVFTLTATLTSLAVLWWGDSVNLPMAGQQRWLIQWIALGCLAVALALSSVIAALLSRRLKEWVDWLLLRLPLISRLSPLWQKVSSSFNLHRHQQQALLRSAIGSTLIVLLTSLTLWFVAQAIQPNSVSLIEMLIVNPLIVFALIAPIAPGGLGVRQVSLAWLFSLIGASYELGVAVGVIQQVISWVVSVPGGMLWLLSK